MEHSVPKVAWHLPLIKEIKMKKSLLMLLVMMSVSAFAEPVTFYAGQVFYGTDRTGQSCKLEILEVLESVENRSYRVEVSGRSCLENKGTGSTCDYKDYKTQRDISPRYYYGEAFDLVESYTEFTGGIMSWDGYNEKEIKLYFNTDAAHASDYEPYYFVDLGYKLFSKRSIFGDCSNLKAQ